VFATPSAVGAAPPLSVARQAGAGKRLRCPIARRVVRLA